MRAGFKYLVIAGCAAGLAAGLRAGLPYRLTINSVPGQIAFAPADKAALRTRADPAAGLASGGERALDHFAGLETEGLAVDERHGGVRLSQIILARLLLGREVERCNEQIQRLAVWGNAGSSWVLHRSGDYDFALVWLTALLYEFGDDESRLYPESREYLLHHLLSEDGALNLFVPRSGGMVFDTENHLLMREGSRYLKNQWLLRHGGASVRLDREQKALTDWLVGHLNHLRLQGVYEFNSTPYAVYTLLPLLNLADYAAAPEVRSLATAVIDQIMERYACGSLKLRQCAPFRRQFKYAESTNLMLNRLAPFVSYQTGSAVKENDLLVLAAAFHDYRLSEETARRFAGAEAEYWALFAHEQKGGAEIYSGGPGWLLSAGGAYQGSLAKVIARPIALLLDDGADDLSDCIHIRGPGSWKSWNMSGVHRRFAVAAGTIQVPRKFAAAIHFGWNVFRVDERITAAVFQGSETALLVVVPDSALTQEEIARLLEADNPDPEAAARFKWPAGFAPKGMAEIGFDIHASADRWVVTSVNGEPTAGRF